MIKLLRRLKNWLVYGPRIDLPPPPVVTAPIIPANDFGDLAAHFQNHGNCPDCGSRDFYEGPSGGLCTNWKCAGEGCGSRYNIGMVGKTVIHAERISEPQPLKGKPS